MQKNKQLLNSTMKNEKTFAGKEMLLQKDADLKSWLQKGELHSSDPKDAQKSWGGRK